MDSIWDPALTAKENYDKAKADGKTIDDIQADIDAVKNGEGSEDDAKLVDEIQKEVDKDREANAPQATDTATAASDGADPVANGDASAG